MLDISHSRQRQKRLLDKMAEQNLDAVVVGLPQHVYYFSTFWTSWLHQSAFVLFADGWSWLATANKAAENTAANEVVPFEAQWMATLRQEQADVVAQMVSELLVERRAKRVGIDASHVTAHFARLCEAAVEPIDSMLFQLRRQKDPDELALITEAVCAAEAMYDHARKIIEPGIAELEAFTQLHQVAV